MALVLTVDQRGSRRHRDRVPDALARLAALATRRGFERTAGDEFQGVLDDPEPGVTATLDLIRGGTWSVGIGAGPIEEPLPPSARAGRGPAFLLARAAVEAAKRRPQHLAVRAADPAAAQDAEAVLTLLAAVVQRRTPSGWQAVDLVDAGMSLGEAAHKLGVSRQAVSQRLAVALWQQEQEARSVAARLLARAMGQG